MKITDQRLIRVRLERMEIGDVEEINGLLVCREDQNLYTVEGDAYSDGIGTGSPLTVRIANAAPVSL